MKHPFYSNVNQIKTQLNLLESCMTSSGRQVRGLGTDNVSRLRLAVLHLKLTIDQLDKIEVS